MSELYAHEEYKGYHIFVEYYQDEDDRDYRVWEATIVFNGTNFGLTRSYISGDKALTKAYNWINKQEEA